MTDSLLVAIDSDRGSKMDEDYQYWNDDVLEEEISESDYDGLVIYSRDWTVGTIIDQMEQGNIDLDPKFQRRNAWSDKNKSLLIESLLLGAPVPEIVLAEDSGTRGKFVVLDGKQRLLTLLGYFHPESNPYWKNAQLMNLRVREDLKGITWESMKENSNKDSTALVNVTIRCTVISHYRSVDVLYDVFYRLNTTSVPLSTQELRQTLIRGPFTEYLVEYTNCDYEGAPDEGVHSFQKVIGLDGPDTRMRDCELLLRFIALDCFYSNYKGNLKSFLDDSMKSVNTSWDKMDDRIRSLSQEMNQTIDLLAEVFGEFENIGRKYTGEKPEKRFNKALFDVQCFYFHKLINEDLDNKHNQLFKTEFKALCNDEEFRRSIETTTKTKESYQTRYSRFQEIVNRNYEKKFDYAYFQ